MSARVALLAATAASIFQVGYAGLEEIEHVVLIMQENRAYDHYFGTFPGGRGFLDPNAQINANGRSTFYQKVDSTLSNKTDYLLPYHINAQGGEYINGTQCLLGGSNSWGNQQAALARGTNDEWALENSAYSNAYFRKADIPAHWAIADAWTSADMYQESLTAATYPNRVMWTSGSVNVPGGNVNSTQGPVLDNNVSPGCTQMSDNFPTTNQTLTKSSTNISCYPWDWKTTPEYLQELGVDWRLYQGYDNWGDSVLPFFKNFIDLEANDPTSDLAQRGLKLPPGDVALAGLEKFKKDCDEGTLAQFSYVISNAELSEHPPYSPNDGGWFLSQFVEALQNSPSYKNTVIMISYDEAGGWADHVVPFHSPEGTAGEWFVDPYDTSRQLPTGPGFRLPFMVVSPWTRNSIFTAPADHLSQILFVEKWMAAKGKPFITKEINDWRRAHMSDLTELFDFANPDYSKAYIPPSPYPHRDALTSLFDGAEHCEALYGNYSQPTIPYGEQKWPPAVESGFKPLRGALTEGRYLVIEANDAALAVSSAGTVVSGCSTAKKQLEPSQRWIVHASDPKQADGKTFKISFASNTTSSSFLDSYLKLGPEASAATFTVQFDKNTMSYTFLDPFCGEYLYLSSSAVGFNATATPLKLYGITW